MGVTAITLLPPLSTTITLRKPTDGGGRALDSGVGVSEGDEDSNRKAFNNVFTIFTYN